LNCSPKEENFGLLRVVGIHSGIREVPFVALCCWRPSAVINEILLTGKEILSGEETLQLGIVNRVAEDAKG
jgi:hypothetical protein